jgi:hypothetical protein
MKWTCTAHEGGLPGADKAGDACFLEDTLGACRNRQQCQSRTRKERRRLLARLHEFAEDGNPIFAEVASELPLPETPLTSVPAEKTH